MNKLALALPCLLFGCASNCPTDDCTIKPRTVVKWTFDKYPERNFPMDSCVDFSVGKVQVDLTDAAGKVTTLKDDCGIAQVVFEGLAPGDYTAALMPLDGGGNPLLGAAVTATVTATGSDSDSSINVPWDAWTGTYTGTFLFRISWGGVSCDVANPMIVTQVLTLTVNGVVQHVMTDDGEMLDGSDRKSAKKLTDQFPQSALGVAFGPATLQIDGYSATDQMFTKTFDTFVGAGITNPTLTFDVPMQ